MTQCGSEGPRGSAEVDAFLGGGEEAEPTQRPAATRHTLEQIADALGVTTALLGARAETAQAGEAVGLQEISALLQAYAQIKGREARQRCLDLVRAAAR